MTHFPSPSGRSRTAKSLAFALFRPVLFAIGAITLALGGLVLTHRSNPEIAALPASPPAPSAAPIPPIVLADPEPAPPISSAELQGFQMKPPEPAAEPEPPASDRYELTLRLERGDTIEKMLADIGVPEADRKQIAEKLQGLLKKKKLATGETIELLMQTLPDQPDAPRVLTLSVRPQPEREYIITRQDDGIRRRGEDLQGEPAHRARRRRLLLAGAERHATGAPSAAMISSSAPCLRRRLPARAEGRPEIHRAARAGCDQRRPRPHPGRLWRAASCALLKRTVT